VNSALWTVGPLEPGKKGMCMAIGQQHTGDQTWKESQGFLCHQEMT
jgi:hypothetical protein